MLGARVNVSAEELLKKIDSSAATQRLKAVETLARLYATGGLPRRERAFAEDAFRSLAYDGDMVLRRVLAEALKTAPTLPADIALALASDRPEVAAPMLLASPALGTAELIRIAGDNPGEHRLAIARRDPLDLTVADALCRCADEETVLTLLGNGGAELAPETLEWLLEQRAEWDRIAHAIARRLLAQERAAA